MVDERSTESSLDELFGDVPMRLLMQRDPDGRYESGADIADDEWIRLKLISTTRASEYR